MFSEYASRFLAESQSRVTALRERRFISQGNESAPLFFSVADQPVDERSQDEEVSDYYALKGSRRHFGGFEPHNTEELGYDSALENSLHDGLRSSWRPDGSSIPHAALPIQSVSSSGEYSSGARPVVFANEAIGTADRGLKSSLSGYIEDSKTNNNQGPGNPIISGSNPHLLSSEVSLQPQPQSPHSSTPFHDMTWAKTYAVSLAFLLATSFMIWIRTDPSDPSDSSDPSQPPKKPARDTIYDVIHKAIPLFALDTLLAVVISVAYLVLLRIFVKPLVILLVISVPALTAGIGIYSFTFSYRGKWEHTYLQARVMRWISAFPLVIAMLWVYGLYQSRKALSGAVKVIELGCKILNQNPALLVLSFGVLLFSVGLTWAWIAMFSRVFLDAKPTPSNEHQAWSVYPYSWLLGAYFVLMYLWTLNIVNGIQRATIAATVSHWYFYRHETPRSSSNVVVGAAFHHATTTSLGTICFSTLLSLLIRLPVLVLPRRIGSIAHLFCFNIIASSIMSLSSPLTLSYAAIHSLPLIPASRQMHNQCIRPTTSGSPTPIGPGSPYYLSKMCLSAIRGVTSLFLGVLAWIKAASDHGGFASLYGYVVGMSAGAIGWAVLGASEGALSNIVDSCFLCNLTEGENARYCHEAGEAFANNSG